MKTNNSMIAGAALAGILGGGFAFGATAPTQGTQKDGSATLSAGYLAADKGEAHGCKGENSCKGKGGCKTGDQGCAGKNTCKGKGGCAVKEAK